MSFRDGPVFPHVHHSKGVAAVNYVRARNPRVFAILARRKNGNLVLLEASPGLKGVEHYWLDLEPSYQAAARQRGRPHDRDEFSVFDWNAYGYTAQERDDGTLLVTMNRLPGHSVVVQEEKGSARAYIMLKGERCVLKYIFIADTEWLGVPVGVDYIDAVGINAQGQEVRERIY